MSKRGLKDFLKEATVLVDHRDDDPPVVWLFHKGYPKCFTFRKQGKTALIVMNLADLLDLKKERDFEFYETVAWRIDFAFFHEMMHVLGGKEAWRESWLAALGFEFGELSFRLPDWAKTHFKLVKKMILDGTFEEEKWIFGEKDKAD